MARDLSRQPMRRCSQQNVHKDNRIRPIALDGPELPQFLPPSPPHQKHHRPAIMRIARQPRRFAPFAAFDHADAVGERQRAEASEVAFVAGDRAAALVSLDHHFVDRARQPGQRRRIAVPGTTMRLKPLDQYRRDTANSAASIIAALASLLGKAAIASIARRA